MVDILKRKRQRRRMSVASLAKRAQVPVGIIQEFEAYHLNSVGLEDLLALSTALGSKLSVGFVPGRPKLPQTNTAILNAFDALLQSHDCNPLIRNEPDKEHRDLRWDIVGDKKRNWLFVVASHCTKKLRFAKVTDEPGGWSIAGQLFGIDAETDAIARQLSDQLFKKHRAKLVALPTPSQRKRDAATG